VIVGSAGYGWLNVFAAALVAGVATAAEYARRTTGRALPAEDVARLRL
jgi:hypothetical protein